MPDSCGRRDLLTPGKPAPSLIERFGAQAHRIRIEPAQSLDRTAGAMLQRERQERVVARLVLDLDGFKAIRDGCDQAFIPAGSPG